MADRTGIANMALSELGADLITDLDQVQAHAKACRARYDDVRDEVLRAHPWRCATIRFELPAMGERPLYGFGWQYAMPNDPYCLRVLNLADPSIRWTVEGRRILADAGAPLRGRYIGRIGEDLMDVQLVRAIAMRLGAAIAYRVTQSQSQVARLQRLYEDALAQARSINATEGTPEEEPEAEMILARM